MSLNNATVRVVPTTTIRATVNQTGGQIESSAPVTLKNSPQNRLDQLIDVIEAAPEDGMALVYRASDDKYVVEQISLEHVTGNLDGGTF